MKPKNNLQSKQIESDSEYDSLSDDESQLQQQQPISVSLASSESVMPDSNQSEESSHTSQLQKA